MSSSSFELLKPICENVMLSANKNNVEHLNKFLSEVPDTILQQYQNAIIFPIEFQLHQVSNTEVQQKLIECLITLFKRTYITSLEIFIHISRVLYERISSGKGEVVLKNVPEELKLKVVECIIALITRTERSILYEIYSRERYHLISPLIFICTLLAKEEKLVKLRVSALNCILTLGSVNLLADSKDKRFKIQVRDSVMLMVPGIVSMCCTIVNDTDLQNHEISIANLKVWSEITSFVMEDDKIENKETNLYESLKKFQISEKKENGDIMETKCRGSNLKEKVGNMLKIKRTEEWLSESAIRLADVTKVITKYQSHRHFKTRKELALSCHLILEKCSRNMAPSVSNLVSTLIILSQDEMEHVSAASQKALQWFAHICINDSGKSLFEILEKDFYSLLTSMPRTMREGDELRQRACLSLLEGYLKLQDQKLTQALSSQTVLNRLIMTLITTVTLETSGITLLEDCSIRDVETDLHSLLEPWKNFKYLSDKKMLCKIESICSVLCNSGNLLHLVHALLEEMETIPIHRKEIILLLNMMLTNGLSDSMQDNADLICNIIDTYLEPRFWNVPISVTNGEEVANDVVEAQSNVIQICLLAEGIGKFAIVLGCSAFSQCVMSCLYPILELAGSPLSTIASAGLKSLQNIAKTCVHGGVTDLVRCNSDYLSHHITIRLRNAHRNPSVLPVLSVVMKHSTIDVLPSLHEIIRDVLVQSCDLFQEQSASAYLLVFHTFMVCINKWYKNDEDDPQNVPITKTFGEKLKEYFDLQKVANNYDNDIDQSKSAEEMYKEDELKRLHEECLEEESPTKEKALPPHIELTVDILNRALHFLPSKDESRQLLVLQTLKEGVMILKNHEEQLLPMVHKVWSPLINRFESSLTKPLVMQYAFQLLCILAVTAKDFIRARTLNSVLPSLCKVLEQSVSESRLKDSGSVYRHTQLYKLQCLLLTNLAQLALDIGLRERDLYRILLAASPYLSMKQPAPLQEQAKLLFKTIASINEGVVWRQLLSIWSPTLEFTSPNKNFQSIKLYTNCSEASEYKKNVSSLLEVFR